MPQHNYEMADIYLTRAIEAAEKENLGVELQSLYESYSERASFFKDVMLRHMRHERNMKSILKKTFRI